MIDQFKPEKLPGRSPTFLSLLVFTIVIAGSSALYFVDGNVGFVGAMILFACFPLWPVTAARFGIWPKHGSILICVLWLMIHNWFFQRAVGGNIFGFPMSNLVFGVVVLGLVVFVGVPWWKRYGSRQVGPFAIALGYVERWMTFDLPRPPQQHGQQYALIYLVGIVAVVGLLAVGIFAIGNQPIESSIIIAFGILFLFIFSGAFVSWQRGRATSGRVLLDCGPHPFLKKLGFQLAALSLFFFLFVGGIAGIVFGVAPAIFWILMAYQRLEVRENGIWTYGGFLKWERLKSFKWEGDFLLVDVKTRFPFFRQRAIPAKIEHQPAIEELVAKHCVMQTNA